MEPAMFLSWWPFRVDQSPAPVRDHNQYQTRRITTSSADSSYATLPLVLWVV